MLSAPRLTADMRESPLYRAMGMGFTDNIFLVGHDSSLELNAPFPVSSMQEAVDALDANTDSPLLLALLEAYYSGARDIWLVAAAPLEEYEPDLEERDQAYYEQYRDRLNVTYETLKKWDNAEITIPIDAPFNSTVDFLGPLVNYCVEALDRSGDIHLGIMGTRGLIDPGMVDALVSDGRLGLNSDGNPILGEAGKFVSVFVGDGVYHLKELPFHHTSSVAVGVAAEMSQLPLDRSMTYRRLRNIMHTVGPDLPKEDINRLAEARLNYVGRNIRGRRNNSFEVIPFTDNTLALDGSDYWSLLQTRLVNAVSSEVRAIGNRKLGTIGYDLFAQQVEEYLANLADEDILRGFDLHIRRDTIERGLVLVDIDLEPYFGLRTIHVSTEVGPGQ